MSRPTVRTTEVSRDVVALILKLFGTVANAHRQLGLSPLLKYPIFYRAMLYGTVKPAEKELIEDAWHHWRELYLRPEVPLSSDLDLDHTTFDSFPSWHPASKPKGRKAS